MEESVRKYASYRKGPDSWALGKFVVPVARLAEFEAKAAPLLEPGEPWHLSALGGNDLSADLQVIEAFHDRHLSDARIDSLEIKAGSADEIRRAGETIGGRIETFYEVPSELIDAVQGVKGRAKVRTGGVKPGLVPSSEELARFLLAARDKVAFKATAGLHHALRSIRPLTYDTGCDTDLLHGFLNVFTAAAFAFLKQDRYIASILEERDARGFEFGEARLAWHGHEATRGQIQQFRDNFLLSFGSCSSEEPIAELKELKLL
jgi:hypothetical protein